MSSLKWPDHLSLSFFHLNHHLFHLPRFLNYHHHHHHNRQTTFPISNRKSFTPFHPIFWLCEFLIFPISFDIHWSAIYSCDLHFFLIFSICYPSELCCSCICELEVNCQWKWLTHQPLSRCRFPTLMKPCIRLSITMEWFPMELDIFSIKFDFFSIWPHLGKRCTQDWTWSLVMSSRWVISNQLIRRVRKDFQ